MNTTHCPADTELQMFVEGTLPGRDRIGVSRHIAACTACRTDVAHYKQMMWDVQLLGAMDRDALVGAEFHAAHDRMRDSLTQVWRTKNQPAASPEPTRRRLLPAWVGYGVMWTRNLPGVKQWRSRRGSQDQARPLWRSLARRLVQPRS